MLERDRSKSGTCENCGTKDCSKLHPTYKTADIASLVFVCAGCVVSLAKVSESKQYSHCEYCSSDVFFLFSARKSPWSAALAILGRSHFMCPKCAINNKLYTQEDRDKIKIVSCDGCDAKIVEKDSIQHTLQMHEDKKEKTHTFCTTCFPKLKQCHSCSLWTVSRFSIQIPVGSLVKEEVLDEEILQKTSSRWYCMTCSKKQLVPRRCDNCGRFSSKVNHEGFCPHCAALPKTECDFCGKVYRGSTKVFDLANLEDSVCDLSLGRFACSHCLDGNFATCCKCDNRFFPKAKLGHHHHYSDYFCQNCTPYPRIYAHNFAPKFQFFGNPENKLFFGVENEIDLKEMGSTSALRRKLSKIIKSGRAWLMHDGTLQRGFEIGYHPMSYEFWMKNQDLVPDVHDIVDGNYTCQGTHVHLSKDAFTTLHLYRFLSFFTDNVKELEKIGRRKLDEVKYSFWKDGDKSLRTLAKDKRQDDRYRFLNVTKKTVEVRMFLSAWDYPQMAVYIQLLDAIFHFTKSETRKGRKWSSFEQYLLKCDKDYNFLKASLLNKKGNK